MIVSVIRHGETPHNKNRVMQGWGEVPLSDLGIQQAMQTAQAMAATPPDLICCSDLRRAVMTGTVLAAVTRAPMVFDAGLRERNPGSLLGRPYEDALPFFTDPGFEPPEGETFAIFSARMETAMSRLAQEHLGKVKHLALVTHGMVPMAIMHFAFGKPPAECLAMVIPNASITTLRYDGTWHMESFAAAAHLGEAATGRAGG
ncbi:MAG: histidine phosphatase family protein [Candidatus Hydrogenedentes bacterium]|nr:histidine phosphatase family protein [Candidatus Hydrogenedentota bacterium]